MAESKLLGLKFPEFAHLTEADIEELFGTKEDALERQRIFHADARFLNSNWMKERYAGKWVAVRDCKVLAHGDTWQEVRQQMADAGVTEYWLTEVQGS